MSGNSGNWDHLSVCEQQRRVALCVDGVDRVLRHALHEQLEDARRVLFPEDGQDVKGVAA